MVQIHGNILGVIKSIDDNVVGLGKPPKKPKVVAIKEKPTKKAKAETIYSCLTDS